MLPIGTGDTVAAEEDCCVVGATIVVDADFAAKGDNNFEKKPVADVAVAVVVVGCVFAVGGGVDFVCGRCAADVSLEADGGVDSTDGVIVRVVLVVVVVVVDVVDVVVGASASKSTLEPLIIFFIIYFFQKIKIFS